MREMNISNAEYTFIRRGRRRERRGLRLGLLTQVIGDWCNLADTRDLESRCCGFESRVPDQSYGERGSSQLTYSGRYFDSNRMSLAGLGKREAPDMTEEA